MRTALGGAECCHVTEGDRASNAACLIRCLLLQQMDRILKEERNYILGMVKKIRASGANVLLIQKSILRDAVTDLSLHYLVRPASVRLHAGLTLVHKDESIAPVLVEVHTTRCLQLKGSLVLRRQRPRSW